MIKNWIEDNKRISADNISEVLVKIHQEIIYISNERESSIAELIGSLLHYICRLIYLKSYCEDVSRFPSDIAEMGDEYGMEVVEFAIKFDSTNLSWIKTSIVEAKASPNSIGP